MVTPLAFFPTPYPDEILYSVLCRFHMRSGNPAFFTTSLYLWDREIEQNLYLPQSLGLISKRVPARSGLTAESLVRENTIFPLLRPFASLERGKHAYDLMCSSVRETVSAYSVCGWAGLQIPKWQYLRYCEACRREDIQTYGEPYWHRLHLLPGVFICPKHGTPIQDSQISFGNTTSGYYPAPLMPLSGKPPVLYSEDTTKKLMALAGDMEWVMRNGNDLPDIMTENYDRLLRLKGYRSLSGHKTKLEKIHTDVLAYYGKEHLDILGLFSDGVVPWTQRIIQGHCKLMSPVCHLLLMRFLAGSAEDFFTGTHERVHPYGNGPWPCRNPVCPHHLEDVITDLPLKQYGSRHLATFHCPHCGFTYRRKNALPKAKQYTGQIDVVDRGWLWMDTYKRLMAANVPRSRITATLQCDFYTISRLSVELGFYPEGQLTFRKAYVPNSEPKPESARKPGSRAFYRRQWKQVMAENPLAQRSQLIKLCPDCYQWLRKNDLEWYENNAPPDRRFAREWVEKDKEYLKKAEDCISYLKNLPGRPVWISLHTLKRYSGIPSLERSLPQGKLPRTKAYLDENLETAEEWRKRKIRWAVHTLHDEGSSLTLSNVKGRASISSMAFCSLHDFALMCMAGATVN